MLAQIWCLVKVRLFSANDFDHCIASDRDIQKTLADVKRMYAKVCMPEAPLCDVPCHVICVVSA